MTRAALLLTAALLEACRRPVPPAAPAAAPAAGAPA